MQHNLFIGNLADDVELKEEGDLSVAKFTLIENQYTGKDDQGNDKNIVTSIRFVAFGGLAKTVARCFLKGDEMRAEYNVRNNNFVKDGIKHYQFNFVLDNFDFGPKGKKSKSLKEEGSSAG